MATLVDLWLPVLLSAVAVFVVSSLIHMAVQLHKNDFKKLPDEDAILTALRQQRAGSGEYVFPCAQSMREMNSPEIVAKRQQGPVGSMVVMKSFDMGRSLLQWFAFALLVSFLVAYLATIVLPRGIPFRTVFRFTSTAAFLGYAFTNVTNSIWKGVAWSTTCKFVFDGLLYALATGAVFAWCWPPA
ncbi:MAG: hypothetical protein R3F56_20315 [Planctomycetota bacterium]